MPIATVYGPDGVQLTAPDGRPLEYKRENEARAVLSAQKAWWPVGVMAKVAMGPNLPPEGAEIRMDGVPYLRAALAPVFADDGNLVGAQMTWVDIRAAAQEAARLAALEQVRARIAVGYRRTPE